jgi:hypothetical protein
MTSTPEETAPGTRQYGLHVALPGDWIAIDTSLVARWKEGAGEVPPSLAPALRLLESAATAFQIQGTILSAVLAERGSTGALATFACYAVGLPALPAEIDLAGRVRAAPPRDAVEGTFVVDEDERAGGMLRARCLRRAVLEVPSPDRVSLAVEYFVPVPGDGGMLVAAFATPNAAREDEYLDLFSRIASTIEITG